MLPLEGERRGVALCPTSNLFLGSGCSIWRGWTGMG
jgi:cytosine/adenosine deaminase-related metal-dependent hydrolase